MKTICFIAYDTLCKIWIYRAKDNNKIDSLLQRSKEIAKEVEATLNMYDQNSELTRMCCSYITNEPYSISDMLFNFLSEVMFAAKMTDGLFDPTIAPLVKLWDISASVPQIPNSDKINQVRKQIGYHKLSLDKRNKTVTFHYPGVQLDPGAAGKGFALGLIKTFLEKNGVISAVLDFGGNLYLIGGKTGEAPDCFIPWKIAIRHPDIPNAHFGTVLVKDAGIATSSWYEHYFIKEGNIYHHILNPRTGYPQNLAIKSISILCPNALYTDILSTVFFLLGEESGSEFIKKLEETRKFWIRYIAYKEDGSITTNCETFCSK